MNQLEAFIYNLMTGVKTFFAVNGELPVGGFTILIDYIPEDGEDIQGYNVDIIHPLSKNDTLSLSSKIKED